MVPDSCWTMRPAAVFKFKRSLLILIKTSSRILLSYLLLFVLFSFFHGSTVSADNDFYTKAEEQAWIDGDRDDLLYFLVSESTKTKKNTDKMFNDAFTKRAAAGGMIVVSVAVAVLLFLLSVIVLMVFRLKKKNNSLNLIRKENAEQKENLAFVLEATDSFLWEYFPGTGLVTFSSRYRTMINPDADTLEMQLNNWLEEVHPDDHKHVCDMFDNYVKKGDGGEHEAEFRLKKADDNWCWILARGKAVSWNVNGVPEKITGIGVDIQNLKNIQIELLNSESRFQAIFDNAPYSVVISSLETGMYLEANRTFLESRGLTKESTRKVSVSDGFQGTMEDSEALVKELLDKGFLKNKEAVVRRNNGTLRHLMYSSVLLDQYGQQCALTMSVDLTELKSTEKSLLESENRFHSLFQMAPVALVEVSSDKKIMAANDMACTLTGYSPEDTPDIESWWLKAYPDPEYRKYAAERWQEAVEKVIKTDQYVEAEKFRVTCRDGTIKTMLIGASLIGERIVVYFDDITQREKEEAERNENLEIIRATLNIAPGGILVVNKDRKIIQTNTRFFQMWRIPETMWNVDNERVLLDYVYDQLEEPDAFFDEVNRLYTCDLDNFNEIKLVDGRLFECYSSPLVLNENANGRVWYFLDITDQRNAEKDRQMLQERLHHAMKLEAIGILAGGVAHDFNNMLGVIIGYTGMILNTIDLEHSLKEKLSKVLDAAERSSDLTRQLLAFARKQDILPVSIDLNESVSRMLKILRRIIGENIELVWIPDSSDCTVHMDPSHLDQLLTNLCINARDAISDVGQIIITTCLLNMDEDLFRLFSEAQPGDYIRLSVSDNGSGMDSDVQKRVFEPFFTTKKPGEGTGLGLATVYGVVRQNGGFINVDSKPDEGTTFHIYFPHHKEDIYVSEPVASAGELPNGSGESLLIVEDDPILRQMAEMMLERLGYNVLAAGTPGEAIRIVEEQGNNLDMFITDVVMPEMNGKDLAVRLSAIRPSLKILFMSGYTADVIATKGVLDEGVSFIQKPFSLKELAVKVREVLSENKK